MRAARLVGEVGWSTSDILNQRSVFEIFESSMVAFVRSLWFPLQSLECVCLNLLSYLCLLSPITACIGLLGVWYSSIESLGRLKDSEYVRCYSNSASHKDSRSYISPETKLPTARDPLAGLHFLRPAFYRKKWEGVWAARSHRMMSCSAYATRRTFARNCYNVGTARSRLLTPEMYNLEVAFSRSSSFGRRVGVFRARRHAPGSPETS